MTQFTNAQKAKEARRAFEHLQRECSSQIIDGIISAEEGHQRVGVMREIASDYAAKVTVADMQEEMFDER